MHGDQKVNNILINVMDTKSKCKQHTFINVTNNITKLHRFKCRQYIDINVMNTQIKA